MPEHPYDAFIWAVSAHAADLDPLEADERLIGLFTSKANGDRFAALMQDVDPRSTYRVVPV